jgi:hypothetical protein
MSAAPDVIGVEEARVRAVRLPAGPMTVIELARVQTRRILRHPALLVSLVWIVLGIGFGFPDTPYEQYSLATGMVLFMMGPATFFAANLVATSERRSAADEWTPALPMPALRRTVALLVAGVGVGAVALAIQLLLVAVAYDQPVLELRWTHVLSVPVAITGAVALGVAVARLLPWPGAPLVVMAAITAANVWASSHQPFLGLYVDFAQWTDTDAIPGMHPGSGAWHLVYLAAFVGLASFGAVLRDVRRVWLPVLGGAVCGTLVLVAGALQL